jgi:hypothetical protein
MIRVKRSEIIQKLSVEKIKNHNGHNHLIKDILERKGYETMAFLVRKGALTFTKEELKSELNFMVENNLLLIGQWEQMLNLLENATNGQERITNFLRKKRRLKIL